MTRLAGVVIGVLVVSAGGAAAQVALPPPPEGYTLVWHDEFDRDGLPDAACARIVK
jgi:hypothetical protein